MRALLCSLSVLALVACDDKGAGPGDTDEEAGAPAADADGDGYAADDCDDADGGVYPGASEVCDGADNDCDGRIDDEDDSVSGQAEWYADADADGYGSDEVLLACQRPAGAAEAAGDCDDADAAINPGASEVCDGEDNDCDALTDDGDGSLAGGETWYADADGDGFGDESAPFLACEPPEGGVSDGGDCDDAAAKVNPAADESCLDGVDTDCDGAGDEACPPCSGVTVLGFYDSIAVAPLQTAAAGLGMQVTAYNNYEPSFTEAYGSQPWDVLVLDIPGYYITAGVKSAVEAQIAAGRKVIVSYWDLDADAALQATLGVSVVRSIDPPLPLYPSPSGLWTAYESLPAPIASYFDDTGDNGDVIAPADPATAEVLGYYDATGSEIAILATFSGQVLVNGFLPLNFQSTDDDLDGTLDMVELYANELLRAGGCAP